MEHHDIDPYTLPRDKQAIYINEPWLVDKTLLELPIHPEPEEEKDNIRVYVPLDINKEAILRRLDRVIVQYGEANEYNESEFSVDVDRLVSQVEIYDQIWSIRYVPEEGKHSAEAVELVKEFVERLRDIPDGCAECFPFETIDELSREYLDQR
ncbi:hypothetical protein [Oribacterium sp. FC2011]|uniref:hypothetical protein n=1 Tax=Oribacterium sp. FC2011 TaxID=1408311 RepID=UPI0006789EFB|nr:hypothetical protein [Oribacterium sp. FC2011]